CALVADLKSSTKWPLRTSCKRGEGLWRGQSGRYLKVCNDINYRLLPFSSRISMPPLLSGDFAYGEAGLALLSPGVLEIDAEAISDVKNFAVVPPLLLF